MPYTPLQPPDPARYTRWDRFLYWTGFCPSTSARRLAEQLRQRTQPDWEAWGPDAGRVALAKELCGAIAENFEWPNAHFIPEDPLEPLLWANYRPILFCDNLEFEDLGMRMGEWILGKPLIIDAIEDVLLQDTLGTAVDVLLAFSKSRGTQHSSSY